MVNRRQAISSASQKRNQSLWVEKFLSVIKIRQLFYGATFLLFLTSLFYGYQKFQKIDILPIQAVEIEGEFKYLMPEDLKQHALPKVQGGFFSVQLETIRDALMQLPWVEDVSIHRQWPQTLRIRVMEKLPVAYWGDKGYVSSKGDLFEPEFISKELALPLLVGMDGQHAVMLKELGGMQLLIAELNMNVVKIKQDARRSWVLTLSSGFELRLGRNNMHKRLQRFVDVYNQHLRKQENNIKHIDMRYTNGFAVAFKDQLTQDRGA